MSAANPIAKRDSDAKPVRLRIRSEALSIIDQAASMLGRTRNEFMIEASRRAAENAILNQTIMSVDADKFDTFVAMLDRPAQPNDRLRELMLRTPLWEKKRPHSSST